jgi:hypothetical protein
LIGCSIEEFRKYFQGLFTKGMTWDLFMSGDIHIDHIIPCAHFDLTREDHQRICFHYTNTQPEWAVKNISRGAKLYEPTQITLGI